MNTSKKGPAPSGRQLGWFVVLTVLAACGGTDRGPTQPDGSAAASLPLEGDEQTPPTTGDAAAMRAWLDAGYYANWPCESASHPARGPSMHEENRGCSNTLASSFAGKGERPQGSAAVKEFWNAGKVYGHAVYVKTQSESLGGDNWFWYVNIDGKGVLANGLGSKDATAKAVCVGCHAAAGTDDAHTTSLHSGDFVYTQVDN